MKFFTLLCVGALCLAIFWKARRDGGDGASVETGPSSPAGWAAVGPPKDMDPHRVVIITVPNCPSEAAQRGALLARQLAARQIPYTETSSFTFEPSSIGEMMRMNKVMKSGDPLVFVNGKAKGNPTFDEVVAEYRAIARK